MAKVASGKKKTVAAHNQQQMVYDRLKAGHMKKPESCSRCGLRTTELQFAHSDYAGEPSGRWLCPKCHRAVDHANPKGGGSGKVGTVRAS